MSQEGQFHSSEFKLKKKRKETKGPWDKVPKHCNVRETNILCVKLYSCSYLSLAALEGKLF